MKKLDEGFTDYTLDEIKNITLLQKDAATTKKQIENL